MPINPRILDAAAKLATANAVTRQQDEEQRVNDLAARAVAQRIQTTQQQQQAARSALPLVTNAVTPLRLNAAITGLQRTGNISPISPLRGVDQDADVPPVPIRDVVVVHVAHKGAVGLPLQIGEKA